MNEVTPSIEGSESDICHGTQYAFANLPLILHSLKLSQVSVLLFECLCTGFLQ